MTKGPTDSERRTLLKCAAASLTFAAAGLPAAAYPAPAAPQGVGKPGDFDFLAGKWKISHRQAKKSGEWDTFAGEATCFTILGGVGSIEELRVPARDFMGSGIRLLDLEKQVWNDYWVNAKSGVLGCPDGLRGAFVDGVGTFTASEEENGQTLISRGVWDRITPTSCRWRQGLSKDGGKTWQEDWFMDWNRVS